MTVAPTKRLPLSCAAMRDVGGNDGSDLRELVSHRYVVEVLDPLADASPMTLADVRSSIGAGRGAGRGGTTGCRPWTGDP